MHHSTLQTFRRMDISTREHFNMGTFRHRDFSAQGFFSAGTFRHGDILAHGHFVTVAEVPKCLCQNVCAETSILLCKVPKYPCAKMFRCRNIPVPKCLGAKNSSCCAENTPCWNVQVLKSPSARTSTVPNSACAKMFPWWNICAKMTFAKMFRAEMVCRRFWAHFWATDIGFSSWHTCSGP